MHNAGLRSRTGAGFAKADRPIGTKYVTLTSPGALLGRRLFLRSLAFSQVCLRVG